MIENLRSWRHQRGDELSCETVVDYFSCCREITEIISSHYIGMFGGEDKIIQNDETFLIEEIPSRPGYRTNVHRCFGICTDNAKQYHDVEKIISSSCTHYTTNQNIAEFVATDDRTNIINDFEAQNKFLKRTIVFQKKTVALY
ncbi:hypothetical protein V1478_005100 [Vespula squamosa]|uniref:Uncharacterized protein n=1 Tax=Vespula squamosa TaxID=30214 RepID=A0ABD2BD66_VESSQ